ncbi:MAG: hypothetical protein IH820_13395, partial [Bacteroidetes bacterium]|nr:hypothetical protein [Bacteroidota bacterium]
MKSAYHNVPTINGVLQKNGRQWAAKDVRFTADGQRATLLLGFALTDQYLPLAMLAFFVGSMAISGSGPRGPFNPLETAALPDAATSARRTDLFAVAGITQRAARFLGTAAAALPVAMVALLGIGELDSYKVMFVAYALLTVLGALVYSFLSPAVEVRSPTGRRWTNPLRLPSRRTI